MIRLVKIIGIPIMFVMYIIDIIAIDLYTNNNKQLVEKGIITNKTTKTRGTLFDDAINHIKKYEGFESAVYIDNSGHKTIGYGHHLLTGENNLTIVTEKQATDILKSDLRKMINYVELTTKLKDNKSLAIGLFTYNVGSGTLQKAINNGVLNNINKLKQYCHYKKLRGDSIIIVTSGKLLERRNYEISLYEL